MSASLPGQRPYSSLQDDPSLPILQGALGPTQAVIIHLGKGWGHYSEGSSRTACFGSFLRTPGTSHLRAGGGGAELVGISLSAEDICFDGSKDPGGTVLKAKK